MLTISSGPRLMADRSEFEKSVIDLPGEGRTYSSKEEGTKIWKNKTLRKYHEPVPKHHRDRTDPEVPAIDYRSDRSDISDGFRSLYRNHRAISATDDQKITADDLDKVFLEKEPKGMIDLQHTESYSYIPTVRDVGIQCNRKKTNRHLLLNTSSDSTDSGVRVIRSSNDGYVSAYSDVPQLKTEKTSKRPPVSKHEVWDDRDSYASEALYSKVDKTKKRSVRKDPNREVEYIDPKESYPKVIYRTPLNERRSPSGLSHHSRFSGSDYSVNTNRTLKNKTKGIGFTFNTGVDGPKVNLPPTSPKLRSRSLSRTRYEDPPNRWDTSLSRTSTPKREVKQEVLEETISISNASSDDLESYRGPDRSYDELLQPKSQFMEVERKRRDISFVNTLPNQRRVTGRDSSDERPLDYRRSTHNLVTYPTASETSYSTLSRFDSKKKDLKPIEFTPPPRQAFTLDRRHMKDKLKQKTELTPLKNQVISSRLHKSTADLSDRPNDDLRGGLANAYKNRQEKRTSSLNRMSAIREGRVSPSPSAPVRYLSHSHLNSAGNSLNSSSESDTIQRNRRHFIHDREPIVMYIPAVSHHNKRADDEPDRLSGILRPNSRSGSTTSSKKGIRKPPKSSASDLSPSKGREYSSKYSGYSTHRAHDEERDQVVELKDTKNFGKLKKGKSILSRRHSIPKDTKFPWLQKLRSKVKFKE